MDEPIRKRNKENKKPLQYKINFHGCPTNQNTKNAVIRLTLFHSTLKNRENEGNDEHKTNKLLNNLSKCFLKRIFPSLKCNSTPAVLHFTV